MNSEFSRIITYLRKSKGLSQKQAASDLGISQGLLSHYEKGIRECGLDFLVRTADYYGVSADYLLGRTPKPDGSKIEAEDIPDTGEVKDINQGRTDNFCLINRKVLNNSTGVIYNILAQIGNRRLSRYASQYLMTAVYSVYRILLSFGEKDNSTKDAVPGKLAQDYCQASMTLDLTKIKSLRETDGDKLTTGLSPDTLADRYPESFNSLHNLIINSEKLIIQRFKI